LTLNSPNKAAGRPDLFGPLKSFPINLQKVYPKSFLSKNRLTYGLVRIPEGRKLVVLGEKRDVSGDPFSGRSYHDTMTLKICDLSAENTASLMTLFPFTKPVSLREYPMTIGTGDRLGLASPGHIRAVRSFMFIPSWPSSPSMKIHKGEIW
jgi:hypothetical protein